jgi:hypothetical protein
MMATFAPAGERHHPFRQRARLHDLEHHRLDRADHCLFRRGTTKPSRLNPSDIAAPGTFFPNQLELVMGCDARIDEQNKG